jgi:hypothetical protein
MATLTLNLRHAKDALQAVIPHASTDDVTPTISAVSVVVGQDVGYFVTTDRYTVAKYTIDRQPDEDFLLDLEAARWVARFNLRTLMLGKNNPDAYSVEFVTSEDYTTVMIRVDKLVEAMRTFRAGPKGNFPPVARLLEPHEQGVAEMVTDDALTVGLGGQFIERFIAEAKRQGVPAITTFQKGSAAKPGPLFFRIGTHFTGLMQPTLILNK